MVRGEYRLAMLMQLLGDEAVGSKPGREVILQHLLEVLLIEAFRSADELGQLSGLVRGLSDERPGVSPVRFLRDTHDVFVIAAGWVAGAID